MCFSFRNSINLKLIFLFITVKGTEKCDLSEKFALCVFKESPMVSITRAFNFTSNVEY